MGEVELSDALRGWRERAGLTQQDLADRAGLSVGGLRDLEQGRVTSPRPATLRRLARGLGLSDVEAEGFFDLGRRCRPSSYELRVWVLGSLAANVDGRSIDLGSARQRTLLALLALTPNVPVPRDTLVDALWGSRPPGSAAGLLQNQVSRLRERLRSGRPATRPDRLLVATQGGYQLALNDDQLDLLEFRRFAGRARRAHRDGDLASANECYRRATASGVAALIRAKFPKAPAREVVQRLIATARDVGLSGRDETTGYGVVDPARALTAQVPADAPNPVFAAYDALQQEEQSSASRDDFLRILPWIGGGLCVTVLVAAVVVLLVWSIRRDRRRRAAAGGWGRS